MRISDWSSDVCSSDLSSSMVTGVMSKSEVGGDGSDKWTALARGRAPGKPGTRTTGRPARAGRSERRKAAGREGPRDRKSVGKGKSGSVSVDLGGRRSIQKKNTKSKTSS